MEINLSIQSDCVYFDDERIPEEVIRDFNNRLELSIFSTRSHYFDENDNNNLFGMSLKYGHSDSVASPILIELSLEELEMFAKTLVTMIDSYKSLNIDFIRKAKELGSRY